MNTTPSVQNSNKDYEVIDPPRDSISCLSFSSKANFLISGSWDSQTRCWEVLQNGNTVPKGMISHESPVLCSQWSGDGMRVFSGLCDGKVKMWNLQTGQAIQIGQHSAGVKSVFSLDEIGVIATGSWDKSVRFWDLRSPNPTATTSLSDRLYCMDVKLPLGVIGTAERALHFYDMRKATMEFKRIESPLKYQSRVISCFIDKTGFALGSIEGRVAIHYIEEKDNSKNFAFKCHRVGNDTYSVNVLEFHPKFGTFATAGSDGTLHFWDKDSRQRLKAFSSVNVPISAGTFNMDGSIFAYAASYDWSKGLEYYNPQQKNSIFLHPTTEAEVKSRGRRM